MTQNPMEWFCRITHVPSPLQGPATVGATTISGRYSIYLNLCSCVFESAAFCCTLPSSLWIQAGVASGTTVPAPTLVSSLSLVLTVSVGVSLDVFDAFCHYLLSKVSSYWLSFFVCFVTVSTVSHFESRNLAVIWTNQFYRTSILAHSRPQDKSCAGALTQTMW